MSKSFKKISPIAYRKILETIERMCVLEDPSEKNHFVSEIYMIAHSFSGYCDNPHTDWREKYNVLEKQMEE